MQLLQRPVDELEIRTLMFWNISSAFHQRIDSKLTSASAIQACNDSEGNLNPSRTITKRFGWMRQRLIQGRGRRRKTPIVPDNITELRRPA